jgi:YggT family protein
MAGLLITLINLLYFAAIILLLARSFMPLLGFSRYHPVYDIVFRITEPVLEPIRRRLPPSGMIDFSPLVAWIGLLLLREVLEAVIRATL